MKPINKGRIIIREISRFVHKCLNCKKNINYESKYCGKCANKIDWVAVTEDRSNWNGSIHK